MEELLARLKSLNIDIRVENGDLELDIPRTVELGGILEEIRSRKPELIAAILKRKQQMIPDQPIKCSLVKKYYQLSASQQRLYFLYVLDPSSLAYNMFNAIRITGVLDKKKLSEAFEKLMVRHEILRTLFVVIDGEIRQEVLNEMPCEITFFSSERAHVNAMIRDFVRPFDLSSAPLMRVGLIEVAEEEHLLLIDMHHIISDGVSKDLLIRDFVSLYQGQHLNPLALQYKDYAEWQQSEAQQLQISKHRDFWLQEFSVPVESLELPYDYSRPLVAADQGNSVSFELNASEQLALKKLAEEEQVSMFMVILSVYVILLGKLGNQEDIVVGSPAAGRDHADLEGLVGMFVNTLALRNYPAGGLRYIDFLRDLKERTLNCFDHQSYPYEELIDELKPERERGRNPLFDVMFSYRNFEESTLSLPGLALDHYPVNEGVSKFDLTLSATDKQDRISFHLEYATSLYKEETILRMVSYFRRIVSVILSDRSVQLSSISVLSDTERETLLYGFNSTERDYPKQESLVSLFDRQAFLNPAAMAVVYGDTQQSYKLLKEKSDRIGGYLREKYGLSKGELIGLMVERGVDLMALIFGILKAGCAYVPVDPSYPSSRKEAIISGSGMKLLISGVAESGLEYAGNCPVVFQEVLLAAAGSYQGDVEAVLLNGNDLAYVIYTSGSTGQPKGVMIEHHAVVNRLLWMQKQYPLSGNDILLQKTPLVFDVSVWELFWWMLSGAGLCILEPGSEKDPALLSSAISRYRITAVHFVPSMLSVFLSALQGSADYGLLKSLRWVFSSGEALKADQVDSFGAGLHEHCGTGLINLYGPTEATVDVSYYECRFGEGHLSIPIGRPIDNLQLYVLGPHQELLPLGVCGELCIGGVGLARGYLNNTGLTAERFIDHPHIPGKKIYRTGDLVKWLPDGEIGYIGRMDDQVKLRGFRIELGEIEYHLSEHDQVVSAAVVVKEQAGDKCLVAYYVAEAEIESLVLKAYLLDKLPNYMVPAYFVHLNAFPLTTNGKLDKKRLPEPEVKIGPGFIAPANETEKDLAEVWAGILGISEASISADRSFFDFGGNSILALRLIYAIQSRFQIQVTLRTVFENVTIRELSILIKNGIDSAGMKIRKAEARAHYPASAAQQRLFYEQLFDRNNIRYNISGIYEFREDGDPSKIERTFQSLINRHEGLRTTFSLGDEGVVQTIHEVLDFEITVRELEGGDIKDIFKTFIKPFNLAVCPLIRCEYVRNKNGDDLLMVDIHHIVCDGLSLNILMNDFKDIYQGKTLKPLNLTYVDYACWQEEDKLYLEKQREFWKQQLSGALPVTDLLTKQDRELVDVHPALVKILEIEGDSYEKIKKMAISSGVSDFMFLLSVHYILLSKMTGETDIIIGTDAMGRGNLDLQDMVGTFVNVLPLRVEVVPEMMFIDFLMSVKECVLGAFDHQDFQYDQLISMLNEQQALQRNLFDVHFSFSNVLDKPADEADWKIVPFELDTRASAHYEITIEVKEKKEQFEMLFVFSEALYEEETIEALMTYYHQILDQVMASHDITIENITI